MGDEIVLYDELGNSATAPREQFQPISTSAVNDMSWPSGPDWIKEVTSIGPNPGVVTDTIKIVVDPDELAGTFTFAQAPLILIGGSTAGYIPDNIRILPITIRCVESVVYIPYLAR
ncbi:MAG: hypothetical protein HC802_22525 [Caldilineaceae bacterium]|nr:hypothetical protein [Caldilineaceae bacterium]